MERWQDLPGYEGYYQCSTLGRIRSLDRQVSWRTSTDKMRLSKGQVLAPYINHRGYMMVVLCKDGKRNVKELHTLIALVFLGPRPKGYHTHHISGNKTNNRPSNLKYVPSKEHHQHHHQGMECHLAKLTDEDIAVIRKRLAEGETQVVIAKDYNVSRSTIGEINRGKTWQHIKQERKDGR